MASFSAHPFLLTGGSLNRKGACPPCRVLPPSCSCLRNGCGCITCQALQINSIAKHCTSTPVRNVTTSQSAEKSLKLRVTPSKLNTTGVKKSQEGAKTQEWKRYGETTPAAENEAALLLYIFLRRFTPTSVSALGAAKVCAKERHQLCVRGGGMMARAFLCCFGM